MTKEQRNKKAQLDRALWTMFKKICKARDESPDNVIAALYYNVPWEEIEKQIEFLKDEGTITSNGVNWEEL